MLETSHFATRQLTLRHRQYGQKIVPNKLLNLLNKRKLISTLKLFFLQPIMITWISLKLGNNLQIRVSQKSSLSSLKCHLLQVLMRLCKLYLRTKFAALIFIKYY
eukprot:NODE_582_length_6440_cov_0.149661.p4 type:complete len:105 gc:universal NODE_582_length_6440_cov_0.149661:5173-4859(-)